MFASTLLGDKQLLSDNVFDLGAFRLGRETSKEVSADNAPPPRERPVMAERKRCADARSSSFIRRKGMDGNSQTSPRASDHCDTRHSRQARLPE